MGSDDDTKTRNSNRIEPGPTMGINRRDFKRHGDQSSEHHVVDQQNSEAMATEAAAWAT